MGNEQFIYYKVYVFNSNKKMIEILMKICAKITIIIVVENREPYYFIIICKCKEVPLSLFSYKMLASTLTTDERSSYYKVYGTHLKYLIKKLYNMRKNQLVDFKLNR